MGRPLSRLEARRMKTFAALCVALLGSVPAHAVEPVWVGRFGSGPGIPEPWKIEQIDKKVPPTEYRQRQWEGVDAVEARAERSMAWLLRPLVIDLGKTPVLCWKWRIEAPVAKGDIRKKSGDDYAARVYLMFSVAGQHLGFGTRTKLSLARSAWGNQVPDAALNYVWDNLAPVGTVLPNAYTDRAMMWVQKSGAAEAGRWVNERRNVLADFEQAFGYPPERLYALAVATDTDQTGGSAQAGFADFRFVDRPEACQ
jgi:hypothetical protein